MSLKDEKKEKGQQLTVALVVAVADFAAVAEAEAAFGILLRTLEGFLRAEEEEEEAEEIRDPSAAKVVSRKPTFL